MPIIIRMVKKFLNAKALLFVWALGFAPSALASGFYELSVLANRDQRTASLSSEREMNSGMGLTAVQTMGVRLYKEAGIGLFIQGDISIYQFNSAFLSSSSSGSINPFAGGAGIQVGKRAFVFRLMGSYRSSYILTEPTSSSVAFTNIKSPEVSMTLKAVPLAGKNHELGFGLRAAYQMRGSADAGTLNSALTLGAQLFLDFSQGGFPISFFGQIQNTTFKTSVGDQTGLSIGGGICFGAGLLNPKRMDK